MRCYLLISIVPACYSIDVHVAYMFELQACCTWHWKEWYRKGTKISPPNYQPSLRISALVTQYISFVLCIQDCLCPSIRLVCINRMPSNRKSHDSYHRSHGCVCTGMHVVPLLLLDVNNIFSGLTKNHQSTASSRGWIEMPILCELKCMQSGILLCCKCTSLYTHGSEITPRPL